MSRTVIIGAGVIGLLCAYELRRRGAEVVVLDRGEPGAGCSAGNAGWIVPSLSGPVPAPGVVGTSLRWMLRPDSPLYIRPASVPLLAPWLLDFWRHCNPTDYHAGLAATAALNRPTMALYDALAAAGVEFEMHADGILYVCLEPATVEHVREELAAVRDHGYAEPAVLGPDEIREFEPGLTGPVQTALWVREERHVRPETLTAGLARWLAANGVEVRSGVEVVGLGRRGREIAGVETRDGTLAADQVLIAAGAWSGALASMAGVCLPMQAGKGYHVTVAGPDLRLHHPMYLMESRIAVSPFEGALRMSGTMELSGINLRLDPRRVAAIRHGADRYLPGWQRGASESSWVGMRPLTPDGLPVIGRAPGYENLFLATGHAMLGVTLGPATAAAIAGLMCDGRADVDLAPFDPARFAAGRAAARTPTR